MNNSQDLEEAARLQELLCAQKLQRGKKRKLELNDGPVPSEELNHLIRHNDKEALYCKIFVLG